MRLRDRLELGLGRRHDVKPGVPFDCTCGCEKTLVRCKECGADWGLPASRFLVCVLCDTVTTIKR